MNDEFGGASGGCEVEYWTTKFGVSRDELGAAVKEVGD
jgi:hypothetical protein